MHIELGQLWKTRSGKVAKVVHRRSSSRWPWVVELGKNCYVVNGEGRATDGLEHSGDLVEFLPDLPRVMIAENLTQEELKKAADKPGIIFAGSEPEDSATLAAETLQALGWTFDGQCWVEDNPIKSHPLYPVLIAAIEQAMYGKGERHGGNVTPFLDQPWTHYAKMHGRGFLTGQAAKKLEEAASTREGKPFEQEVLGAIVYAGMSILKERGEA